MHIVCHNTHTVKKLTNNDKTFEQKVKAATVLDALKNTQKPEEHQHHPHQPPPLEKGC